MLININQLPNQSMVLNKATIGTSNRAHMTQHGSTVSTGVGGKRQEMMPYDSISCQVHPSHHPRTLLAPRTFVVKFIVRTDNTSLREGRAFSRFSDPIATRSKHHAER